MEIELVGGPLDSQGVRRVLGAAGLPVIGDARNGGILVAGGARLRAIDPEQGDVADDWWPNEPLHAGTTGAPAAWRVSAATRRVVERGHPWLLDDDESESVEGFAPGTLVVASDRSGVLGLVRVDGGRVAARVWALGAARERDTASVEARVAGALSKRRVLLDAAGDETLEVVRLIHGEADGLPGLFVDRVGPLLRILVSSRACERIHDRVIDAVVGGMRRWLGVDPPVIEVLHLRERPRGRLECVRSTRGPEAAVDARQRLVVRERALRFWVDPGLSQPARSAPGIGLFADQRDNRARLAAFAGRGGRWLNLFAHTGAFSAALLQAGAGEVVSVDLSGAYLRWLEENLELNGLRDARHTSVRKDGRRFLEGLAADQRFDGIVLDPPSAAAAGRRYWSVSRDLAPLVRLAADRLDRGGVLLVSHNLRRRGRPLARVVEDTLGKGWSSVRGAPPSPDFPRLTGFPEGDAFEGILAERA
jgi:23S rRNA (cytosine1962-C5)-methyltransferase